MNTALRAVLTCAAIVITGTGFAANQSDSRSNQQAAQAATGAASANEDATPVVVNQGPGDGPAAGANIPDANPGPVTIPNDGNMPGSGSAASANAPARTDDALRSEAYSAELRRCETLSASDKIRCVATLQKKQGQM